MNRDRMYQPTDLTIVRNQRPVTGLFEVAQIIGFEAWTKRMPDRSKSEIENVFKPNSLKAIEKLQKNTSKKIGRFVSIVAFQSDQPIGYAWASDDVGNMSHFKQRTKRMAGKIRGKKPYAWIAQINVLPDYQGNGFGSAMVDELLKPFDQDQKVSSYVFDENQLTLQWFKKLGFNPRPAEPVDPNTDPNGPDLYFGDGAKHVLQWRLESSSVANVRQNIAKRILPEYVVEDN